MQPVSLTEQDSGRFLIVSGYTYVYKELERRY